MTTPPADVASGTRQDGRWALDGVVGSQDDQGRPVSGRADLVVAGGTIERLAGLGPADHPGGSVLVLVPLFINAHDHGRGTGTVAAGIADAPLEEWISTLRRHPPSNQEALVGQGCDLMVASGVGASVICPNRQTDDTGADVIAAAEAVMGRGVRAAVVYPIADTTSDIQGRSRDAAGWGPAEVARNLAEVEEIAAKFEGPLIEVQLGPVGPQWGQRSNTGGRGPPRRNDRAPGAHAPARVPPSARLGRRHLPRGHRGTARPSGPGRARGVLCPRDAAAAPRNGRPG